MQLQWKWASAGLLPLQTFQNLTEADPLAVYWSDLESPSILAAKLDACEENEAVRIRAAGQPQSMKFENPLFAARWLRQELVEEHEIILASPETLSSVMNRAERP